MAVSGKDGKESAKAEMDVSPALSEPIVIWAKSKSSLSDLTYSYSPKFSPSILQLFRHKGFAIPLVQLLTFYYLFL